MFVVLPLLQQYSSNEANTAPFFLSGTAKNLPPGSFPTEAYSLLSATSNLRTSYIQDNPSRSYVMQWNLNVQRQLTPDLTASVAYVGSAGVHLPFHMDDGNMVLPTATSAEISGRKRSAAGTC